MFLSITSIVGCFFIFPFSLAYIYFFFTFFNFKFRNCFYCSPDLVSVALSLWPAPPTVTKHTPFSLSLSLPPFLFFSDVQFFELIFSLLSMLASVTQHLHSPMVSHSSLSHPQSATPKAVASSIVSERYISVFLLLVSYQNAPLLSLFFIRMIFLCNCVWYNAIKTYMLKYNTLYHQLSRPWSMVF